MCDQNRMGSQSVATIMVKRLNLKRIAGQVPAKIDTVLKVDIWHNPIESKNKKKIQEI